MAVNERVHHLGQRRVRARAQPHPRQSGCRQYSAPRQHAALDAGDHAFGLGGAAVGHQPARAFRQPQPHEEDHQRKCRADEECKPPAVFRIDHRRIEQHDGAERAQRRADPEAAVDDEIGPAAHAGGYELLDGRVDRGVFAADAGAGEKAKQREAPEIPGQRGGRGGAEIDRKRDEEELLAPEPVGQPAEEQRAEHGAGQIGAGGETDVGIAELQAPDSPSVRPPPSRRASLRGRRGSR